MGPADQWRWTDDEGVQRLLEADELRAALADGRLKPGTLVWRRGMSNWVPAREVAELMEAAPDSRADTVTRKRSGTPGSRAKPSPSVPPTDSDPKTRPANMVDIASLRAKQGRPAVNTLMGVGEKDKDAIRDSIRGPVRIPSAPKLPAIDGGWREGAARHDDDEETVTRVRPDDDRTLAEGNKRPTQPYTDTKPSKPRQEPSEAKPRLQGGGARSVPPPLRRRSKDGKAAAKVSKPPPGPRRPRPKAVPTLVSSHDKSAGKPSDKPAPKPSKPPDKPPARPSRRPPPATPSSAVLSESFDRASRKGTSPTGAIPVEAEQASQAMPATAPLPGAGPSAAPDGSEARPHLATGPLPEAHELELPLGAAPEPARPEPATSRQPWDPPEDAGEAEAGGQVDLGMAALAAATRPMPSSSHRRLVAMLSPTVLMAAAGVALVLIAVAFLFGRLSAPAQSGLADVVTARAGLAAVPLFTRTQTAHAAPRPCLMLRAPALLADGASRSIPIEFGAFEGRLAVGYGRSIHQARGMLVNLGNGEVETVYKPDEVEGSVSRVVPLVSGSDLSFGVTMSEQESVNNGVYVPATTPFVVGFGKGTVVKVSGPGAEPVELWPLDAKRADALRVTASAKGTMITYRAGDEVHYGMLGPDGEVTQAAQPVMSFELPEGKRAIVGKPVVASNGQDVSVVFAYKAAEPGATVEMRWARGPIGKPLTDAALVDIPVGGPGGDAIAPAIASIGGGRWLLMWTEGKSPGPYTLRAQTYDRRYRPIGEALRVSPATGSFGQGTVGAVGDDVAVLFLLATRTSYEVWGTVLQCR